MNNRPLDTNRTPEPTNKWLNSFENTFIGLTENGIIQHVIGLIDIPEHRAEHPIEGLHWDEFVTHVAADDAKDGLLMLWAAVGQKHVAPAHYPAAVPFTPGFIAQLRTISGNPEIAYAVHIAPSLQYNLDTAIGTHTLSASKSLLDLSQRISRGVYGPLTDLQVKAMGSIVTLAETLNQFFNDLRTEVTAPTTQAPMPRLLAEIMGFTEQDFSTIRRISTHRLGIETDLPDDVRVYCYKATRAAVKHIIRTLFENLTARTNITLAAAVQDDGDTVCATISYHTTAPELQTKTTLHPIELFAAERFQQASPLQHILTSVQAVLSAVNGRVWANPVTDNDAYTMRISIVLPRWHD